MRFAIFASLALLALPHPAGAAPLGTAFTYQGELTKQGTPYTGTAFGTFKLYDAPSGGNQVSSSLNVTGIPVSGGLFTVELDFGGAYTGNALWLEISIGAPPDGGPTLLTPRQKLTPSPYALNAAGLSMPIQTFYNNPSTHGLHISNAAPTGVTFTIAGFNASSNGSAAGVYGEATATTSNMTGVYGRSTNSPNGTGVYGVAGGNGVWGRGMSAGARGVFGESGPGPGALGVNGESAEGNGVHGFCFSSGNRGFLGGPGVGVAGHSATISSIGVKGRNDAVGTEGWLGAGGTGVFGHANSTSHTGGYFTHGSPSGVALRAVGLAQVNTLQLLGADLAETFPVEGGDAEPGTVLVLGSGENGELRVANEPYSKRVAGVVSGANGLNAGVVLRGESFDSEGQAPVALSGRVWVKCDATRAPIRVGDLLTTAGRPGHSMAATDRERAYGAILGKAMTSLESGTGLVLVLVNLQ